MDLGLISDEYVSVLISVYALKFSDHLEWQVAGLYKVVGHVVFAFYSQHK